MKGMNLEKILLTVVILVVIIFTPLTIRAEEPNKVKNIFIGDSRTVMMYFATHSYDTVSRVEIDELVNDEYWKCKGASEYTYMANEAIPAIEDKISSGTNVFILFGVNNANNINKIDEYAGLLQTKAQEWSNKGAKVYYVSVGPVGPNAYTEGNYGYREDWVLEWNKQALEKFDWTYMTYINIHDDLGDEITFCGDDIHFSHSSSRLIYSYLLEKAEENEVNSETSKANHKVIINSIIRNFEKSKRPYNMTIL